MTSIRFEGRNAEFFATLRNRINAYFSGKQPAAHGQLEAILEDHQSMFGALVGSYLLVIIATSRKFSWIYLGPTASWDLSFAGIGFNVMHDGAHGSYSKHSPGLTSSWQIR